MIPKLTGVTVSPKPLFLGSVKHCQLGPHKLLQDPRKWHSSLTKFNMEVRFGCHHIGSHGILQNPRCWCPGESVGGTIQCTVSVPYCPRYHGAQFGNHWLSMMQGDDPGKRGWGNSLARTSFCILNLKYNSVYYISGSSTTEAPNTFTFFMSTALWIQRAPLWLYRIRNKSSWLSVVVICCQNYSWNDVYLKTKNIPLLPSKACQVFIFIRNLKQSSRKPFVKQYVMIS